MKLVLSLLLSVFALLGVMDAGYITYSEITGNFPPCRPPFACREVLESPWSRIGPIPLYSLGLLYYSVFFVLTIILVTEKTFSFQGKKINLPKILLLLSSFGALFSLWLLFVMGVILKAWCLYCLFSAINCLIIFILSLSRYRNEKEADALYI
jgi:uncharacterized membrane protein